MISTKRTALLCIWAHIVRTRIADEDMSEVLHKLSEAQIKAKIKELASHLLQLHQFEQEIVDRQPPFVAGVGRIPGKGGSISPHPSVTYYHFVASKTLTRICATG